MHMGGLRGYATGASAIALALANAAPALAQQAKNDALQEAEDAFGGSVGNEDVGIYTATNVRGFNPQQAGNARIDGVYFDQLSSSIAQRLRDKASIRVGFAALDTFAPSPTGIVALTTHVAGDEVIGTFSGGINAYSAHVESFDLKMPVIADYLSLGFGFGHGVRRWADGYRSHNYAFAVLPKIRLSDWEIKPFVSGVLIRKASVRPITSIAGPFVPKVPGRLKHIGQKWADGRNDNFTHGLTVRGEIVHGLYFRGGFFHSELNYDRNFTEIYTVTSEAGDARHLLLADPVQKNSSNSWEGLLTYHGDHGRFQQRFIAGARGRFRKRETGGSQLFNYGPTVQPYGERDERPEPLTFDFGELSRGKLRQVAMVAGYIASLDGVGQVNLGINKTDYDASFTTAAGVVTHSRANPWLYNASVMVKPTDWLSFYAGTATGLEDTGVAPENAANRNEQLPALKTRQVDAGVQAKIRKVTVVASLFQIKKPYFAFDAGNIYTSLGTVRHRGLEISAMGDVTSRLHLLAGAVLMDPVVSGDGVREGIVGDRPVGTPKAHVRLDLSYRSALLKGLTFTAGLEYDSKRAASSVLYAPLDGQQLFLPSRTTVDLGFRHHFELRKLPVSLRFLVENVFDKKSWDTIASGAFRPAERRSWMVHLVTDF
jgi:iron complex outermembrane receptor protein